MLSKPIIRDLSEAERNQIFHQCKENIGYTVYQHSENEEFDKTKILTAHVLNGVNITPEIKFQSSLRTKVIEELHESITMEKDSISPTTSSEAFEIGPSPVCAELNDEEPKKGSLREKFER